MTTEAPEYCEACKRIMGPLPVPLRDGECPFADTFTHARGELALAVDGLKQAIGEAWRETPFAPRLDRAADWWWRTFYARGDGS